MRFSPLKAFFPTAPEVLSADLETLGPMLLRHLKTYEAWREPFTSQSGDLSKTGGGLTISA